jgi:hypothetical protein
MQPVTNFSPEKAVGTGKRHMKIKALIAGCVLAATLGAAAVPAQADAVDRRLHHMQMRHDMHRMMRHERMRHEMHRMMRHERMRHRMHHMMRNGM